MLLRILKKLLVLILDGIKLSLIVPSLQILSTNENRSNFDFSFCQGSRSHIYIDNTYFPGYTF